MVDWWTTRSRREQILLGTLGGLLLIPLLAAQILLETGTIPSVSFFWHLRNPFLWAGYFVLGWWVRMHREAIATALVQHRVRWVGLTVGVWLVLVTLLAFSAPLPRMAIATTAWLTIFVSLALGFVVSAERDLSGPWMRPLRWLSDASYPVYLFHLFFLSVVAQEIQMNGRLFEPEKLLAIWLSGVAGPIGVVWLGRKLLGARSRTLLGA